MDKLDDAVDNFVQRLETAIAPGLSFKQFVTVEQSIEESVTLELGDSALDHFIHKKFRDQLASHRVRLQQECEKRYHSRCQKAHKLLFEGGGASDLRQDVFLHLSEYAKDPSRVERDWDQWSLRFLSLCGHGESSLSSQEESLNSNVDSSSQGEGERQVQVQVPGEESRVLLEVLKSAAVQLVANVNSEAAQQVAVHKQALLKVHEQLDQSSLDIIRLQGQCLLLLCWAFICALWIFILCICLTVTSYYIKWRCHFKITRQFTHVHTLQATRKPTSPSVAP